MISIYGKQGCGACEQAKQLCNMKGIEHEYLMLGVDYQLKTIVEIGGGKHKTFPMITKDGEYVGGLQDLKNILK
jgi:Glutaredoxin and related proteins